MTKTCISRSAIKQILKIIQENSNGGSNAFVVNKWELISGSEFLLTNTDDTYQTNYDTTKKLLCFAIKSTKDIKTEVIVEFKKYTNSYSSNYYVYLNDSLLHPDGISDSQAFTGSTSSSKSLILEINLKAGVNNLSVSFDSSYENRITITLPSIAV